MTPGLVGFIASGRDETAWEQGVVGALAALATEFEVVPERGGEPAAPAGGRCSTPSTGGCTGPG